MKAQALRQPTPPAPVTRRATLADLDALVALEEECFESDRLTRRNFRYLLSRGHASTFVEEAEGRLIAYATVLYHDGTSLARLYSFAVHPGWRRQGVARTLLETAERDARDHGCVMLRLEVRRDNAAAIRLYRQNGYEEFGTYPDYYEDHMEALRLQKRLAHHADRPGRRIPYYEQTTDFTCGPSALMMAMKALDPALVLDRRLELRLWREATTIFMTSGHGGCGPMGLALAAYRRGFDVSVFLNSREPFFIDSVRSAEKREVIRLVAADFLDELRETPIPLHYRAITVAELEEAVGTGAVPVVLTSSYRLYKQKFPHYLVVTDIDDRFIYAHDPLVDRDRHKSDTDTMHIPIARTEFERMTRYGRARQQATLLIRKRKA